MRKNSENMIDEILSRLEAKTDDNFAEKRNRLSTYLRLIQHSHSC